MGVLMKCGHVSQAVDQKTGKPVCAICIGLDPGAEVPEDEVPDLEGRFAVCCYSRGRNGKPCKNRVPSSFSLAFFEYRPNEETDLYYCGCWGWD